MSVLHSRIRSHGAPATMHPVGTGQTPMVMPLASVTYDGADITHDTLHPVWAADGSPYFVAARPQSGSYGQVVPAGRP